MMTWIGASSRLWLLNTIDDEFMFAISKFQQISAFEPNCREPLLYHGQRICSPFFLLSSITVASYRANIITLALLLPPEPCLILKESHHLPLHSASLSAPCGPSLPFIRLLPCRKRLVKPCKAELWGSWSRLEMRSKRE